MEVKKALAATVIAMLLGGQILATFVLDYWAYYWPFTNYPMYSWSYSPGASFSIIQPIARTCGPSGGDEHNLTFRDIGVTKFVYYGILRDASQEPEDDSVTDSAGRARRRLTKLVRAHVPEPICTVELKVRTYTVEEHGVDGVPSEVETFTMTIPREGERSGGDDGTDERERIDR